MNMEASRIREAITPLSVIIAIAAALAGCKQSEQISTQSQPVATSPAKPVRYLTVSEQMIGDRLDLGAKVQPDPTRVFRIFPPVSGKIFGIQVKPGDRVNRGQVLGILDSSDSASARSDFVKAKIEAERTSRAAYRERVLFEHGAAAEKDYIDVQAQCDSAAAELARARQRLEILGINQASSNDRLPLLSPTHGVVLIVGAAPGEFTKSLETSDPLITIADLSTVWIVGDVYEKDISKVRPGKPVSVTLDAYPGQQWRGRIESLYGALDPATRTLKVRVALHNSNQFLKPEMFAAIHVDLGSHRGIAVPVSAVIHEGQTTSAFVENNGKPEQRIVGIGQVVDGSVEITSGLQTGQQIAVDGADLLAGGTGQQ
jgi:membrane fusion protein, heavy metal efflux system